MELNPGSCTVSTLFLKSRPNNGIPIVQCKAQNHGAKSLEAGTSYNDATTVFTINVRMLSSLADEI
jgi:hypothetical protein